MSSGVLSQREMDPVRRVRREVRAGKDRAPFVLRPAINAEESEELKRRLENVYLIDGRYEPGTRPGTFRRVWAIYRLCGKARPELVEDGFLIGEEAALRARDWAMGRVAVAGFGGIGNVFKAGGGILGATRQIDLPGGQNGASLTHLSDGRMIVQAVPMAPAPAAPEKPAAPKIVVASR